MMSRAAAVFAVLATVVLCVGIGFFFAAGAADDRAEQEALDNATCSVGELLDLDGDYSDCVSEEDGGGTQRVIGWVAVGGAALLGGTAAFLAFLDAPARAAGKRVRVTRGDGDGEPPLSSAAGEVEGVAGAGEPVAARDVPRRACPECGEMVATSARLCRFCRSSIDPASDVGASDTPAP